MGWNVRCWNCVFVLAIVLALCSAMVFGDYESFMICNDTDKQEYPAVSGDRVVWVDYRNGGQDIYGWDISDANEIEVCLAGGDQLQVDIDDDVAVWRDRRDSVTSIYAGFISDPCDPCDPIIVTEQILDGGTTEQYPAIDSGIVVWRDKRNGNYDIYGYDLAEAEPLVFCDDPCNQYHPDIDGDHVVWQDYRNGNHDVYGYNLTTEQEMTICIDSGNQYYPKVSGNIVVWQDDRNGNNDIYGYDLATWPGGSVFSICTDSADQMSPEVSDGIVVWHDKRNEATSGYDIYGYNVTTGEELEICMQSGDQRYPDIAGSLVVWQDSAGAGDIYGAYIPEPSILILDSPGSGEMLLGGSQYTISWYGSGPTIDYVMVEYSLNNGQDWDVIDPCTANIDSYFWNPVPSPASDSHDCLIRLSDVSGDGGGISQEPFTIFNCADSLTADIDGDCKVGLLDFAALAQQWFNCGNPYDPQWCD